MRTITPRAAAAIRDGINLGRLIAVEAVLSQGTGVRYDAWKQVPPYRGPHYRAYRRAVDRAADREAAVIYASL